MKHKLEELKESNSRFMMVAAERIGTDKDFIWALRRAANSYSEPARYDGLQEFHIPLGFIYVDAIVSDLILSTIQTSPNLLADFMTKVYENKLSMYVRDDNSKILLPFDDRLYGSFNLILDITGYTYGQDKSFAPIKNPLKASSPASLERIANFEFKLLE